MAKHKPRKNSYPEKHRAFLVSGEWQDCPYCENTFHISEGQVDHLQPIAASGKNRQCNMLLVCAACNQSKSNKVLVYWLLDNHINPERVYWHLKSLSKEVPQSMLDYLRYPE